MAAKLTRLTHKIALQLHLVEESCNICSSRSRRPVRKLLGTPSYIVIHSALLRWAIFDTPDLNSGLYLTDMNRNEIPARNCSLDPPPNKIFHPKPSNCFIEEFADLSTMHSFYEPCYVTLICNFRLIYSFRQEPTQCDANLKIWFLVPLLSASLRINLLTVLHKPTRSEAKFFAWNSLS
jgi:hypothetical protein